ncbi:MAG: hypothetical protein J3T61_11615 [Candidatus Brocadiales bacterium]|nr:hypothetical protein [Candidatus Bathyanammoxibius sp.]
MSKHNLVSMKRTKKDKRDDRAESVDENNFPYGLTISLDDESLTKLGIKELPPVGEAKIIVAVGRVSSVSENSNERRTHRNMSIQIEKIEIAPLKKGTATDAVSAAIKDV